MRARFAILFILLATFASAHLSAGQDKVVGDYLVDFGYTPEIVQSNEPTTLQFKLYDNVRKKAIDSSVSLRILYRGNPQFEGTLGGDHTIDYVFSSSGDYTLQVLFSQGEAEIVETEFDLYVGFGSSWTHVIVGGIVLLGILGILYDIFLGGLNGRVSPFMDKE